MFAFYRIIMRTYLGFVQQVIKKKSWVLSQNLSLSLEYGTIDRLNAQVPWLQLHTGQVNLFVDTVVLIFKLNVLDHDKDGAKGNESFTQELKMVNYCI